MRPMRRCGPGVARARGALSGMRRIRASQPTVRNLRWRRMGSGGDLRCSFYLTSLGQPGWVVPHARPDEGERPAPSEAMRNMWGIGKGDGPVRQVRRKWPHEGTGSGALLGLRSGQASTAGRGVVPPSGI